jgi:serine/threonine protein kinase
MQPPSSPQHSSVPLSAIGRYQLRAKLGSGAFGTVYRGYDPQLDREVALKVLNPEALLSQQAIERFHREARAAARMHHPYIVPVYDAGQHDGQYFIASAFIPGRTLAAIIPEGGLAPQRAAALITQLAEALSYAHKQGVLHRDVKPGNIMVDEQDTLYLMDFGLAAWIEQSSARVTKIGALLGTPSYMAPEQAGGDMREVGPAADSYAAGVELYELLTGRVPFEGPLASIIYHVLHTPPEPPSTHRPGLDARLEGICLRAMAKRPEDRFAGAQEMAAAVQEWLTGQDTVARLPDVPPVMSGPPPIPVPAIAPLTVGPDVRGGETVHEPPLQSSLPPPLPVPTMTQFSQELATHVQGGPPQHVLLPPARTDRPAPRAKRWWPSLFLPKWRPWMLPVAAISALGIGLVVLIALIQFAGQQGKPPPHSEEVPVARAPRTTSAAIAVSDATLTQARKDAEAAWEQIKKLDRGQGFGTELDAIVDKWKEAEQLKDAAEKFEAIQKYTKECDILRKLEEARRQALANRERARQARERAGATSPEKRAPMAWEAAVRQYQIAEKQFETGDMDGAQKS